MFIGDEEAIQRVVTTTTQNGIHVAMTPVRVATTGTLREAIHLLKTGALTAANRLRSGEMDYEHLSKQAHNGLRAIPIDPQTVDLIRNKLKEYNINFALKPNTDGERTLFFEAKDADVFQHAITELEKQYPNFFATTDDEPVVTPRSNISSQTFSEHAIMNADIDHGTAKIRNGSGEVFDIPQNLLEGLQQDVKDAARAGISTPYSDLTIAGWKQKGEQARWALDFEHEHGAPPSVADWLEHDREAFTSAPQPAPSDLGDMPSEGSNIEGVGTGADIDSTPEGTTVLDSSIDEAPVKHTRTINGKTGVKAEISRRVKQSKRPTTHELGRHGHNVGRGAKPHTPPTPKIH